MPAQPISSPAANAAGIIAWQDPGRVPGWRLPYAAAAVDGSTLLLQSEQRRVVLRGETVVVVAREIDNRSTVAEIAAKLAPDRGILAVAYVLAELERAGFVEAAGNEEAARPIVAIALETVDIEPSAIGAALAAAGLRIDDSSGTVILACQDLLDPRVQSRLLQRDRPVLLIKPGGCAPTVGPLFPLFDAETQGPCPECFRFALSWNRPAQRFLMERQGRFVPVPAPASKRTMAISSALAASALDSQVSSAFPLCSALLELNANTLALTRHKVRKRPQCPRCGNAKLMADSGSKPFELVPHIAYRNDGGFRVRSPEQTFRSFSELISPITGFVQYLHPMPNRHVGLRQVYVSGYASCPQVWPRDNAFDKICAGKGLTEAQAQTGALCEALERASSVWQGDESAIHASYSELGSAAISFDALQGFSKHQFEQRESINALSADPRRQIPHYLEDAAIIAWTPAWSLSTSEKRLVPLAYCYAETPPAWGSRYGIYNPNGTAAGSVLEEALLQGLLELIERDAVAIWWYQQVPRPGIDPKSLDDPSVCALLQEHGEAGWRVALLDITHDFGIPVCAAIARHERLDRYALGFGCHLEASIAISRALTELNQLLDVRPDAPPPWDRQRLPGTPDFLKPTCLMNPPASIKCGKSLLGSIEQCLHRLSAQGLQAFMVNKTRPDIQLAVAQVIVPGLRHFWPRFGPGRLYDVPVSLGWRARALTEAELCPAPLFL